MEETRKSNMPKLKTGHILILEDEPDFFLSTYGAVAVNLGNTHFSANGTTWLVPGAELGIGNEYHEVEHEWNVRFENKDNVENPKNLVVIFYQFPKNSCT